MDIKQRTEVLDWGIYLLGGQPILFPTETLDKKEKLEDVCGYLNYWADENAILNPCPPFYRGEEVSEDVIVSELTTDPL